MSTSRSSAPPRPASCSTTSSAAAPAPRRRRAGSVCRALLPGEHRRRRSGTPRAPAPGRLSTAPSMATVGSCTGSMMSTCPTAMWSHQRSSAGGDGGRAGVLRRCDQAFEADGRTTYVENGRPTRGEWYVDDDGHFGSFWPPSYRASYDLRWMVEDGAIVGLASPSSAEAPRSTVATGIDRQRLPRRRGASTAARRAGPRGVPRLGR